MLLPVYKLTLVYYLWAGYLPRPENPKMTYERCSCGPGGCHCGPRDFDVVDFLLWQASRARAELFREKVKKHLEARRGKKLDEVAEAVADYLHRAADASHEEEKLENDLRSRVRKILGEE